MYTVRTAMPVGLSGSFGRWLAFSGLPEMLPRQRHHVVINNIEPIAMFPKRFQDPKSGFRVLSSMHAKKYLNKIGMEGEDYRFFKQVGKALLCTYAILGALWLSNESSTVDWEKLKPWPKEELVQDHLSRFREFLHPGEKEAKEIVDKGGMIGTTNGLKGVVESDKDAENNQKELDSKKFDQEAQNLWLKMRNEVIAELQEKGYDVE